MSALDCQRMWHVSSRVAGVAASSGLCAATTTLVAPTGWGSVDDKRRSSDAGLEFHLTTPVEASEVALVLTTPARSSVRAGDGDIDYRPPARPHAIRPLR